MAIGQTQGDVITDFEGASIGGGDVLATAALGAGAAIAHAGGGFWTVSDGAGIGENFQIVGVTNLSKGDYIFV